MGIFTVLIGGYVKSKVEDVKGAVAATIATPPSKVDDEPPVRRPRESRYRFYQFLERRREKEEWDEIDRIKRENEARKQKISPETKKSLEQMAYERKVIESFQEELKELSKKLYDDVRNLNSSIFSCMLHRKIAIEKIKYSRLHMLSEAKVTDLLSFKEKARAAMVDKDVVRGFTSRSRKLLQRIVDAPMTEQNNFRSSLRT